MTLHPTSSPAASSMVNVVAEATVATTTTLPAACVTASDTQCAAAPTLPNDRSSPTAKPWAVMLVQIVGVAALQMTPRASGRVLRSVNVTV